MNRGLGAFGESWACGYLTKLGYKIIDRNVRCARGELDIVARDGDELVFVEVKCRRTAIFGPPEASITARRFEHLANAVAEYLQERDLETERYRVDVVAIRVGSDGRVEQSRLLRGVEAPRV